MTKRILIAGGTGLIGSALTKAAIAKGYEVQYLSRSHGAGHIVWDPSRHHIGLTEPASFHAIINLAGSSLADGRWTNARKKDIIESRIDSAQTIREYLSTGMLQATAYLGISGAGYYRNSGNVIVDETTVTSFPGDFLVNVVRQWEQAHQDVATTGIRTSIVRTGIVLSKEGGALKEILNPAKFGVIPYFGNGKQTWPWIHITDLVNAFLFIIEKEDLHGIFIGAAPNPVSNKKIAQAINQQLSPKRIVAGVPAFLLKIILGELHTALLDSCHAYPARLLNHQFQFRFPLIHEAMKDLLKKENE